MARTTQVLGCVLALAALLAVVTGCGRPSPGGRRDDLITLTVSFTHVIMPVEEVKKKCGNRIAILGGIDVSFLTTASVDEVRRRTREVLDRCTPGGGYALGTGNSVANYIPVENYIAMLETGWEMGRY